MLQALDNNNPGYKLSDWYKSDSFRPVAVCTACGWVDRRAEDGRPLIPCPSCGINGHHERQWALAAAKYLGDGQWQVRMSDETGWNRDKLLFSLGLCTGIFLVLLVLSFTGRAG